MQNRNASSMFIICKSLISNLLKGETLISIVSILFEVRLEEHFLSKDLFKWQPYIVKAITSLQKVKKREKVART